MLGIFQDMADVGLNWVMRQMKATYHNRSGSISHRCVHHIGVSSDPADVGSAPVGVTLAVVKHVAECGRSVQHVASSRVQNSLGLASRTTGENNHDTSKGQFEDDVRKV